MPAQGREPARLALHCGEVHVICVHGFEQFGRPVPLQGRERTLVLGIVGFGVWLIGGIERIQVMRIRNRSCRCRIRSEARRSARAQLVQPVDVCLEHGALFPRPERLVQIGVQPGDRHLSEYVGRAALEAPARKLENRPRLVSAANWSPRLAARIDTPSLRVAAELASCGIPPAAPEKQQSRISTASGWRTRPPSPTPPRRSRVAAARPESPAPRRRRKPHRGPRSRATPHPLRRPAIRRGPPGARPLSRHRLSWCVSDSRRSWDCCRRFG